MNNELTPVFDWLISTLAKTPHLSPEKATQIMIALSEIAFVTKDYEKLRKFVDNQRLKSKLDEKSFYHQGNIFYEQGDMKLASIFYKIATIFNDKFPEAWFNWGLTLYNMAKDIPNPSELYMDAIEKYKKASEYDPKNAIIYNNWGDSHYRLGEFTLDEFHNAINLYNKALELNNRYLKAYYNRGLAYACLQDYTEAIKDFDKVIELNPYFAEAYHIRGMAYHYRASIHIETLEIEKDLDFAVKDYKKTLELSSDFTECSYHLAQALTDLSEYEKEPILRLNEADKLYSQLTTKTPPQDIALADIWNDWGNLLYKKAIKSDEKKKFYYESTEKYERALELEPQKAHIWENLINTLIQIAYNTGGLETFDWFQKAWEKCEKALNLNPDDSRFLYWHGYSLSRISGDFRKNLFERKELAKNAVIWGEKLLSLEQNNPDYASNLANILGNIHKLQENPVEPLKRSLSLFENVVFKQEQVPTWQKVNYAITLLEYTILCPINEILNIIKKARSFLLEACDEDPKESSNFFNLGSSSEIVAENTTGIDSVGHYRNAAENFEKSASLTSIEEDKYGALGRAFICRYFSDKIEDHLNQAKEQLEKLEGENIPTNLFQLARISALQGDKEKARQFIKKALADCWILPQHVQRDPTLRDLI